MSKVRLLEVCVRKASWLVLENTCLVGLSGHLEWAPGLAPVLSSAQLFILAFPLSFPSMRESTPLASRRSQSPKQVPASIRVDISLDLLTFCVHFMHTTALLLGPSVSQLCVYKYVTV